MKIAILGYGKMGKEIEAIALERKHEVILKINAENRHELEAGSLNLDEVQVAIEFSNPTAVLKNIHFCLQKKLPVVVGTTGWHDKYLEVTEEVAKKNGSLLAATNFSVGVNIFFELNRKLTALMNSRPEYSANLEEVHHLEKIDSPSGTAITLAEDIIEQHKTYKAWVNEHSGGEGDLPIISKREENVPGTHMIEYQSKIDAIKITHEAKNRKGFALGAVLAAEFLHDKKGVFTMKDVLKF